MHFNTRQRFITFWYLLNVSCVDAMRGSQPFAAFPYRGGGMGENHSQQYEAIEDDGTSGLGGKVGTTDPIDDETDVTLQETEEELPLEDVPSSSDGRITKAILESFLDEDGSASPSTQDLREMIATKQSEYLDDSSDRAAIKLIHSVAPKIPAIRHSPDVRLRIRATASDPDPGIAACLLVAAGSLVERLNPKDKEKAREGISTDRRFEQVCECMLCGVNEEYERNVFEAEYWGDDVQFRHIDEAMADALEQGLSLRDCCRAACGLSSLCSYESTIGQEQVSTLFVALMRRVCCLLRLEFHRLVTSEMGGDSGISIDTLLSKSCGQLAENTLLALWSFCKPQFAGTSLRPLVDFCCAILCLDPLDLRKRYQDNSESLGANDVVDRLVAESDESEEPSKEQRDVLLDWLTSQEIVDTVYALACEGSQNSSDDEDHMLREISFDRLLHVLLEASKGTESSAIAETVEAIEQVSNGITSEQDDPSVEGHTDPPVEFVDAASLLAKEAPPAKVARDTFRSSFSSLDLCTIAWAATELNASLRTRIVSRILHMLSLSDQSMLEHLPNWALIGAAWAFSKIDQDEDDAADSAVEKDVLVVGWIVDEIVRRRGLDLEVFRYTPANLLSRLVCSIGVIYDKRVDGTRIATTDASDLTRQILKMAAVNDRPETERFLTEDQVWPLLLTLCVSNTLEKARIVWSFLVLQDNNLHGEDPNTAHHLGRLICRVEASLLRWERGTTEYHESAATSEKTQQGKKFRTRVGRQYFRIPFSARRHSASQGRLQMDSPSYVTALPHLRDLPVDPQTLCKLSNACEKSFSNGMGFGESLTRIALRLYTSNARGGKMMSESSVIDLVRLLEAVVSTNVSSGRELVSYFARLSVRHLNCKDTIQTNIRTFAILSWALGSLGVKYRPDEAKKDESAFKRLTLVTKLVVSQADEDFRLLSNRRLFKLISGIVKMKSVEYFPSISLRALEVLMERIHQLDETQLCTILQTTGALLTSIQDAAKDQDSTDITEDNGNPFSQLRKRVNLALVQLCTRCEQIVSSAKPSTLRLFMASVLLIGLEPENLVNAIEREAFDRLEITDQIKNATSFEAIFELPENNAIDVAHGDHSLAPFESIKVTLQSLFANNDDKSSAKLSSPIDLATAEQLFDKAEALRKLHGSTGLTHSFDSIFELGRCLELVSGHRSLHAETNDCISDKHQS